MISSMRRLLFLLLLMAAPAIAADAPRLIVLIVIDQFPSADLDRMPPKGHLRSLLKDAAIYPTALEDHVPTETAPGHATIATGRPPGVHGIIGNEMYDRKRLTAAAAVNDPQTGRKGPGRLKSPTLADAWLERYPNAKVVSLSAKDRAAILLGGRSPTAILWYEGTRKSFVTAEGHPLPLWTDAVNASLPARLRDIPAPFAKDDWLASPDCDRAVVELASAAMTAEHLGSDDTPDLLLISLSATDYIGHRWGHDGAQMATQFQELDERINELVAASESAAPHHVLFALTSDHGVLPVPESPAGRRLKARRINPEALQKHLERRLQAIKPAGSQKWILWMKFPDIYLNRSLEGGVVADWKKWLREASTAIAAEPGVAAVYLPGQTDRNDSYADLYRRSYYPGRSGDLQFRLQPYFLLAGGSGTSHGTPYDYDTNVPLIFWGDGVHALRLGSAVSVESLAPTLAAAAGVPFSPADGRILLEAITPLTPTPTAK